MKKYFYVIAILIPHVIIPCASPQSGQRAWNIATKNIFITQAVESSLDIVSSIDTIAAFSNLDQILDRVTIVKSKASLLVPEIDHLQSNIIEDLSQTQQIQSDILLISSGLTLLDISSVFTALDALQATIVSAMDLLNTDLESIASNIDLLAASEVQYFQTVASQLDKLDDDVAMVNSLLDGLSEQFSLATFDSITDLMQQNLATLESNVDVLADQLESGFEDTFGILDQNMLLAQTIESLADTLDVMDNSDLTGTYSLLDQLEISVQTMDSLVDLLIDTFENIESAIDVLGSALDESVSKYIFVESRTSLLIQKIEDVINSPAFSRVDHATSLLDRDISLVEHAFTANLPALTSSIESKLNNIIVQQNEQISNLDTISAVFSRVATALNETDAISKFSVVNSLLDDTIDDAFAAESYLDSATHIEQLFVITDNAQDLQEQISYVDLIAPQISSKMALVDDLLATTDSSLDIIDTLAQSNLDYAITLESIADTLSFVAQPSGSITSILDVISSQEDEVISKLALASQLIASENNAAQGLMDDFQSTWTILQSIDTKLAQAYSSLSLADVAMDEKFESFTFLFDTIDAIIANENTVNSQVDVYNSMVDVLSRRLSTDFNGIFTALTSINPSVSSSSSLLSTISSKLLVVQTELGFPIYTRNIPLTITTPGRYYLAENINYAGASNAITVNTNNVSIDLNGRTLRYTGASSVAGISINGLSNISIFNGTISSFNNFNIHTSGAMNNFLLRDITSIATGIQLVNTGARNIYVRNCILCNGARWLGVAGSVNATVKKCSFMNHRGVELDGVVTNLLISNCQYERANSGSTFNNCIGGNGTLTNILFEECVAAFYDRGILSPAPIFTGVIAKNNKLIGLTAAVFTLRGSEGIIVNNTVINSFQAVTSTISAINNYFIGFNNFIQNTGGNIITGGVNTVLGNFAFNTNAVGNPNNTNYNFLGGTNIAGKFVTISQRTGISGSVAPTYWHNINMLP